MPMPDRGGRLFKPGEKGEAIDPESRFYATLIAEGGIIPVLTPRTGRSATCGSEGARDDARSAVAAAPAAKTKGTTRKPRRKRT
ncbi:hypothetical protein [Aquibium oceanicum]|nr:hypothetical protein [Aquibium oceanicum]